MIFCRKSPLLVRPCVTCVARSLIKCSDKREMSTESLPRPTVGIVIIGDEILKGQTKDTNSHFLCKRLFCLGVKVQKISVIGDDVDDIAKEVMNFSKNYSYVITSGGIGPTHDDRTYEGIAKAFGDEIVFHPDLVAMCKKYFETDDINSPKYKLAQVPKSARLHYSTNNGTGKQHPFPLIISKNVHIFPGIPSLLEQAFAFCQDLFCNPNFKCYTKELYINESESNIVEVLNEVDELFRKHILLGSYPDLHNSYYKVKLILESESMEYITQASEMLRKKLSPGCVVDYEPNPIGTAVEHVYELLNDKSCIIKDKVRNALVIIEEALDRYSFDELCVGFNGGKDCTTLLHLVYAAAKKKYGESPLKLQTLYIRSKLPFPEVELFIQESTVRYDLDLLRYDGRMKEQLEKLKGNHPNVKAVLMGTRRTDPYSKSLKPFSMTDSDWPQLMRINPLLDWTYHEVWIFLRALSLRYCSLYDNGYTSLGSTENTHPNLLLEYIDERGIVRYRAAWELENEDTERHGRL